MRLNLFGKENFGNLFHLNQWLVAQVHGISGQLGWMSQLCISFKSRDGSVLRELQETRVSLLQSNPIVTVPRRHVGKDYLVAWFQPLMDFDGCNRTLAELDGNTHCVRSILSQQEQRDGSLLLAKDRTPDLNDVLEVLKLNGSFHAKVGPRAFRQLAFQRHVHG